MHLLSFDCRESPRKYAIFFVDLKIENLLVMCMFMKENLLFNELPQHRLLEHFLEALCDCNKILRVHYYKKTFFTTMPPKKASKSFTREVVETVTVAVGEW